MTSTETERQNTKTCHKTNKEQTRKNQKKAEKTEKTTQDKTRHKNINNIYIRWKDIINKLINT